MAGLFDKQEQDHLESVQPLARRMRPRTLDEFVGQQHFLGPGKLLPRILQADRIGSLIFFGPPGSGKTGLAEVIARQTRSTFRMLNAAAVGVKELRTELEAARNRVETSGERTVLFVDELHHFNKSQQDVLLPDLEAGIVAMIGATTANPFFSLVPALLSRSQIFEFQPLSPADLKELLTRALRDRERGFGTRNVEVTDDALDFLAEACDGDARRALTALEIGVRSLSSSAPTFDLSVAEESIQRKALRYDPDGDQHYDVASAFIKSIRGSDPQAAVYWLARMIESGEDPRFIARRIVISAAEDIGNADPQALVLANAAAAAVDRIGMPEGRIILSQAVTYLACAPKSNAAYRAINSALDEVRNRPPLPVPKHLQDAHYRGAERLGRGQGYLYPHDAPEGWLPQDYLGAERSYYEPVDRGLEAEFRRRLAAMQERKRQEVEENGPPSASDS